MRIYREKNGVGHNFFMVKKGDIPNSEWKKGKADP